MCLSKPTKTISLNRQWLLILDFDAYVSDEISTCILIIFDMLIPFQAWGELERQLVDIPEQGSPRIKAFEDGSVT